jgi:hypothetical protein
MKIHIILLSPLAYHFIPLGCSPQHLFQMPLNIRDEVSYPYKTTGIIIFLINTLIFIFFRQQMRRRGLNWIVASLTHIQTAL